MKREKFLWPLTQGHHGALVGARNVRDRLSKLGEENGEGLLSLAREVSEFFNLDLAEHFRAEEEELMKVFEAHVGPNDPGLLRIKKDHEVLRALSAVPGQKELLLFADTLMAHVRYEEDVFFPRVEMTLTTEEKILETEKLLPFTPGSNHCPKPSAWVADDFRRNSH